MRARTLGIVVGVGLAAAAAWFLRPGAGDGPAGGDAADAGAGREAPGGPGSGGPGAPADGPDAGALARGGAPRLGPASGAPRGRGAVVGTVRRRGVPTAARVEVRFLIPADVTALRRRGPLPVFKMATAAPLVASAPALVVAAGPDGRFVVEGLGPGAWHLRALADGTRGGVSVEVPADGARVTADVELGGGDASLRGRVLGAEGRPFTGAVVVSRSTGRDSADQLVAVGEPVTVDADGRFVAEGLERGAFVVTAIEPGALRASSRPVDVPFDGEFLLTVQVGTIEVAGRVVADATGAPIAGAEVFAGGQGGGDLSLVVARGLTDATGAFRVRLVPGPNRGLVVAAAGYMPATAPFNGNASVADTELRLVAAGRVVGRVTSAPDGRPVAGVVVEARNSGRAGLGDGAPATTDADGRYTLEGVMPAENELRVSGRGYVLAAPSEGGAPPPRFVQVEPGREAVADLTVVLGARVAGVVLGPDGAPVAGAVVRARPRDAGRSGGVPPPVIATGADGLFLLDGLEAGAPFDLDALGPDGGEARVGPVTASSAEPPPRTELRLVAPRTLVVTVLDADTGAPVPSARVHASVERTPRRFDGRPPVSSDAEGRARLSVPVGVAVRLWVDHAVYRESGEVAVAADATTAEVRLRRGLGVEGRVLDPDGRPVPDARVTGGSSSAFTDAAGRFTLRSLAPGAVTVEARWSRMGSVGLVATATVEAGAKDVELRLARPTGEATALLVRVVGPDGKPVHRARVAVEFAGGGSSSTSADQGTALLDLGDRRAQLAGATVRVDGARSVTGFPLPFGPVTVGPLVGTEVEVEARLPAEQTVSGVVVDADGAPVAGVVVVAVRAGRVWVGESVFADRGDALGRVRTDAEGRFRVGGVGSEPAWVLVQAPSGASAPEPVEVRGGDDRVRVVLPAVVAATVTVLDEGGAPVPAATVSLHPTTRDDRFPGLQQPRHVPADAAGVARLPAIDLQRTWSLRVEGPGGAWLPFAKTPWAPRDETVRLRRAYAVEGVVRDGAGKPLVGFVVYRATGDGGWAGAGTDADGRFRFDGLPAGEVVLRTPTDDAPHGPTVPEARVAAGARDVVLTVDVGAPLTVRVPEAFATRIVTAWITRAGGGAPRRQFLAQQGAFSGDSLRTLRGLAADDRVTLWMPPQGDDLSALLRDVAPGREVTMTPTPGRSIRGRVTLPRGAERARVAATLGGSALQVAVSVAADGAYELAGLPEGTTWSVAATALVGGAWVTSAAVEVPAGGAADFVVEPAR